MSRCPGVLLLALAAAAAPLRRRARGGPSDGTSLLQVYNSSQKAPRKASREVHNSSQKAPRKSSKEAQRAGRSLFPKCEDLHYVADVWGMPSVGLDLTYYSGQSFNAGALAWIGCPGGKGCPANTFFCSGTSGEGIEFGTHSHLPLRARLGDDNPGNGDTCASNFSDYSKRGVSNALDGEEDARALCRMMGFADGYIRERARGTISGETVCPVVSHATGEWELMFEPRSQFTTSVLCIEVSTTTSTTTATFSTVSTYTMSTTTSTTITSRSYTSHTHTSNTPTTLTTVTPLSTTTSTLTTPTVTTATVTKTSTTTTTSTGIISCASLVTNMKVWGHTAIGVDVGRFLPSLRWMGCVENVSDTGDAEYGCQPSDFYCTDLTGDTLSKVGFQIGTTAITRPMRALLGPTYFRNTSAETDCASPTRPKDVLSSFGRGKDVVAFCEQLGFQWSSLAYGTVTELQCPRILFHEGVGISSWTTDYVQRQTFARTITCKDPINPYR